MRRLEGAIAHSSGLKKAYAQRDRFLIFVNAHWALAPLAGEARFEHLLRRMGL
jgi:hypothetical protein